MEELWRVTHKWPQFEVSNMGRLRRTKDGSLLKPGPHTGGYKMYKTKSQGSCLMHRLVAIAFLPNPENRSTVNHKNGNKTDNRAVNLEWVTTSQNVKHAIDTGLNPSKEETHPAAVLTREQVIEMRRQYHAGGITQQALADIYRVTFQQVSLIVRGKSWKTVPMELSVLTLKQQD